MKDEMTEGWHELRFKKEKYVRVFYDGTVVLHVVSDYERAVELPARYLRNRFLKSQSELQWRNLPSGKRVQLARTLDLSRVLREAFDDIPRDTQVLYGAKHELEDMTLWVKENFPVSQVGLGMGKKTEFKVEPLTTKQEGPMTMAQKKEAFIVAIQNNAEMLKLTVAELGKKLGVGTTTAWKWRQIAVGRRPAKSEAVEAELVDEEDLPDEASLNAMVNESLNEAIYGTPNEVAMEDHPVDVDSRAMVPFSYEGNPVRVIRGDDGEPWFVAFDICKALGYAKPENATARHCKKKVTTPKQGGGFMTVIPESDLYRLILRSDVPNAERFQSWVVEDVLPKIRKHGGYIAGEEKMDDDQLIAAALLVAQRKIAEKNRLIAEQQTLITEQAPKVEIADKFINNNQLWTAERVAKVLANEHGFNIGRNRLIAFMRDKGIFQENNSPLQKYVDRGYFRLNWKPRKNSAIHDPAPGWTGKGFEYTLKVMGNSVYEAWLKARKGKAA